MNEAKNEPAFPIRGFTANASGALDGETVNAPGMSLRDWFAGQALAGLSDADSTWKDIAKGCYVAADAMLAERAKANPERGE